MGDLLIRNLDDAVLVDLQRRAEANHTSPEEEARRLLERGSSAAEPDPPFDYEAWRARAEAIAREIGPLEGPNSTQLLRVDRYGEDEDEWR